MNKTRYFGFILSIIFVLSLCFPSVVLNAESDDTIPPIVIISNNYKISTDDNGLSSIVLSGEVKDNIKVSSMLWQAFRISNKKLSSDNGVISFTADPAISKSVSGINKWKTGSIPLKTGDNLITIVASDAQNNLGIQSVNILLQSVKGKPNVTVSKPMQNRIKGMVFYIPA